MKTLEKILERLEVEVEASGGKMMVKDGKVASTENFPNGKIKIPLPEEVVGKVGFGLFFKELHLHTEGSRLIIEWKGLETEVRYDASVLFPLSNE
jgi:hypothetical protein